MLLNRSQESDLWPKLTSTPLVKEDVLHLLVTQMLLEEFYKMFLSYCYRQTTNPQRVLQDTVPKIFTSFLPLQEPEMVQLWYH